MRNIKKHKEIMNNQEVILQKERQGIPIKDIAKEYKVAKTTIYCLLRTNGIHREKRVNIKIGTKPITILPFKERISPETLLRMKENTRSNKGRIKYYEWPENFYPMKKVLEGV